MKLLLSLTALTVLTLTFTSCKKEEFTCKCTGGISGGTYTQTVKAKNTEKAKKDCIALSTPRGTNDGVDCALK